MKKSLTMSCLVLILPVVMVAAWADPAGQLKVREQSLGSIQPDAVAASLATTRDNRRMVYAAGRDGVWRVVENGRASRAYDAIGKGTPLFSPDGRHLAFVARQDGKRFVVLDGREGRSYESIGSGDPVFSPDGKRMA